MNSSKYSLYSPINLLVFSICMAFVVIAEVAFVPPMVLRSYDFALKANPLEYSSADFHEEFGYWGRSRQTLYASFAIPPIIGFALAIALRKHIRNLLLRNQRYFRMQMRRRLMRWDGIGLKELREEISIFPRFVPLLCVIIFLSVSDYFVFPWSNSVPAFLATGGFTNYGTWKRMFSDAMSLDSTD